MTAARAGPRRPGLRNDDGDVEGIYNGDWQRRGEVEEAGETALLCVCMHGRDVYRTVEIFAL
uniref:Uncharacterized protein n=1 Tax=Arundo donax TaxID=35708 RepID=A0A0A9BYS7_ARUDO